MQRYIVIVALVAAMSVSFPHVALCLDVGKYDLFETAITNTNSYGNKFKDVSLTATFTSPSSQQTTIDGFYDGGTTWRVRFMPDATGSWSWTASFSDSSSGASGSFNCAAGSLHGPILVKTNNRIWFKYMDGTPFYMRAFHLWYPEWMSSSVLDDTLDHLKSEGFNTIVGPYLQWPYTHWPWPSDANGNVTSFQQFDLTEWQKMDTFIQECQERGMYTIPFQIMGRTNGCPWASNWEDQVLLMKYWVARWQGYFNASYQPICEWEEKYTDAEISAIGAQLNTLCGGKQLVSIHACYVDGGRWNKEAVEHDSWYKYRTIQWQIDDTNNDPTKYQTFVTWYNHSEMPILAHECLWEGNSYLEGEALDVDNQRKSAWEIALAGGQIAYADCCTANHQEAGDGIPHYSEEGAAMGSPGGWLYPYLKILGELMQWLPFTDMTLQPNLSNQGVCLAQAGQYYVTYTTNGGTVSLDLSGTSNSFTGRWKNPRTGEAQPPFSVSGGAVQSWSAPSSNDWALFLIPPDSTAPDPVVSFTATAADGGVELAWTNPSTPDYRKTIIRYSTTGYPATVNDGTLVVEDLGVPNDQVTYDHTGLTSGATYYYSAFTHDGIPNYSTAAHASAKPRIPGDFDDDGDVDQEDFGYLQACFAGAGQPYPPGCEDADLNGDNNVDLDDFSVFQNCMGGANQPPGC